MAANAWPQLPVAAGVQSNCWKFTTVYYTIQYVINIISTLANGGFPGNDLANLFFFIMYQYHSLYYTIEITEEQVHIKGGPCQWCESCNNKEDIKHWCSAAWCFSSQLAKADIVAIERRNANCWPDYVPRGYCYPVVWCCCHKSYNGWYFPWCCECCQGVNCAGCCEGDKYPVCGNEYVTFHLSESPTACLFPTRCTPNIYSCCTYNRVSYVLRDPSVVDQLKQAGYQVLEVGQPAAGGAPATGGDTGATQTAPGTTA